MPNSLPAGYALDRSPPPRKPVGVTPPAGYRMDAPGKPTGEAHDGDTFALDSGRNARLFGVDAFELKQSGKRLDGSVIPLGTMARDTLIRTLPGAEIKSTGDFTYGRPVVTAMGPAGDLGLAGIHAGTALPMPSYLSGDPERLRAYMTGQREAIAGERGAYAGNYQTPTDFRHTGSSAPFQGKTAMTPAQASEYTTLLRNPKTSPTQLNAWFTNQGKPATNTSNILAFMRLNPTARVSTYFQQADALDHPVAALHQGTIPGDGFSAGQKPCSIAALRHLRAA